MKLFLIVCLIVKIILVTLINYSSANQDLVNIEQSLTNRITRSLIKIAKESLSNFDLCPTYLDPSLDQPQPKKDIDYRIKLINSSYLNHLTIYNLLLKRLDNAVNQSIHDTENFISATFDSIEVNTDVNVNSSSIHVDDIVHVETNLTYNQLIELGNDTEMMLRSVQLNQTIVEKSVVFLNSSETFINGSCCLYADIKIDPKFSFNVKELLMKQDDQGDSLLSSALWGVVSRSYPNFNLLDVKTFQNDLTVGQLESPLPTDDWVLVDQNSTVNGQVHFENLTVDISTVNYTDDSNQSTTNFNDYDDNFNSLLYINEPVVLPRLTMENITVDSSMNDAVISGVDFRKLFISNTDQYVDVNLTIRSMKSANLTLINQINGDEVSKLSKIIMVNQTINRDKLTIGGTIIVDDLTTHEWDDYLLTGSFPVNISKTLFSGPVTINGTINAVKWSDLVDLTSNQTYESNINFTDGYIDYTKSDDDSGKFPSNYSAEETPSLIKRSIEDDEEMMIINGDLEVTNDINDISWDEMIKNLVPLYHDKTEIIFQEPVDVDNCEFEFINDISAKDLVVIGNVSENLRFTDKLVISDLNVNDLDGFTADYDTISCSSDEDIISNSENESLDSLTIEELELNGTINNLSTNLFVINQTNQNFENVSNLFVLDNIDFDEIIMDNLESSGSLRVELLNNHNLSNVVRSKSTVIWPDQLVLGENIKIEQINNVQLTNILNNILNSVSNQIVSNYLDFSDNVEFNGTVSIADFAPSIFVRIPGNDDGVRYSDLEIHGNLTLAEGLVYLDEEIDGLINVTFETGFEVFDSLAIEQINSTSGLIFNQNEWRCLLSNTSNLTEKLSANVVQILGNIFIEEASFNNDDDESTDCFDPIKCLELSHEVTFENLVSTFKSRLSFSSLKFIGSDQKINLDDVAVLSTNESLGELHFEGEVRIEENITTDQANINLTKQLNDLDFNYSNEFSDLMFTDEVLIIGDITIKKEQGLSEDDEIVTRDRFKTIKLDDLLCVDKMNGVNVSQYISDNNGNDIVLDRPIVFDSINIDGDMLVEGLKYWGLTTNEENLQGVNGENNYSDHEIIYQIDFSDLIENKIKERSLSILEKQKTLLNETGEISETLSYKINNNTNLNCPY